MGHGKDAVFLLDEVFHIDLARHVHDLGLAVVAELGGDLRKLVAQDLTHQRRIGQHALEISDLLQKLLMLGLQLFPVEPLQSLQTHIQNGLRLDLVEPEPAHQPLARVVVALPDDPDHLVDIILRDEQTL